MNRLDAVCFFFFEVLLSRINAMIADYVIGCLDGGSVVGGVQYSM